MEAHRCFTGDVRFKEDEPLWRQDAMLALARAYVEMVGANGRSLYTAEADFTNALPSEDSWTRAIHTVLEDK